ncbi:MAG: aspartate aminotransferase family protein [bacterium]|nr:aspartate aminotransferase family protein [bacterium]
MNQKAVVRKEEKLKPRDIFKLFARHVSRRQVEFLKAGHLDILETGRKGIGFTDGISGRPFIDAFSSAGCFNAGRGNSGLIDLFSKDLRHVDMGTHNGLSAAKIECAQKLAQSAPGDLNRVIFAGSGAEAIEGALKLAMGATGRDEVISMVNAYHGHSGFALSAGGKDYYKELFQPLKPGFHYVPFGDISAIRERASEKTAAIIIEPVQGEGGIHVADNRYLRALRSLCDLFGILLIFDEIQTGFGRTGRLWFSEYSGVVPDIMTVAKSFSGGIYPNGAVIFRDRDILNSFIEKYPSFNESFGGGSDPGCRVSSSVLDYIIENNIPENAEKMGTKFMDGLSVIMKENPKIIKEVRGKGLMLGVEYLHEFMGVLMADNLAKEGIFAVYSGNAPQVMRFMVPITVTEAQVHLILEKIRSAVRKMGPYLFFMLPLAKIPVFRKIFNNVNVLIFFNNLLRNLRIA